MFGEQLSPENMQKLGKPNKKKKQKQFSYKPCVCKWINKYTNNRDTKRE